MRDEFNKRTKLAAWERASGHCEKCTAKLYPGYYEYHHIKECAFGGEDSPENCLVVCRACHRKITAGCRPVIDKSSRVRAKHIGAQTKSRRPFPMNRNGAFKKKIDGTVERRTTGGKP